MQYSNTLHKSFDVSIVEVAEHILIFTCVICIDDCTDKLAKK